jgi:Ser-tRNA(Ala) deacylase AlaX
MAETILEYLQDMYRYTGPANVLEVRDIQNGRGTLVLDKTIFYPQGGGQACDTGLIESATFHFVVESVTYSAGIVLHSGNIRAGQPTPGSEVTLTVDRARRHYNSCLQSGGHLLLNAMENIGQTLIATKGYHFPDGPYVEFAGSIPEQERDSLLHKLQTEINRLIEKDVPIAWQFVPADKLREVCKNVPTNVPTDKPTRVVTIEQLSQPCGGTHVPSSAVLRGMTVDRIKSKKGDTRISYSIPKP